MPIVTNRFSFHDTPKSLIKNSHKTRLRRDNAEKIAEALIAQLPEPEKPNYDKHDYGTEQAIRVPAAVLVWDDGLDWNLDGTPYQDDYPGEHPHSYHRSLKDAEMEAGWLEHTGTDPRRIRVVENYWVPFWDAHRIPS